MSKSIAVLEKSLDKAKIKYRTCAENVIKSNVELEQLERNFVEAKKLILTKIERNIDARDEADKETIELRDAINVLRTVTQVEIKTYDGSSKIPDWGKAPTKPTIDPIFLEKEKPL